MKDRKGVKTGWTAGWAGGFIWVFALSMVFLFQGKTAPGILGIALFGISVFTILFFSPWRFPSTHYWKLMLSPYGVFSLSVAWAIWSYGGFGAVGLNWWNLLCLLPMLTPFVILGKRKWSDSAELEDWPAANKGQHQ